MVEKHNKYTECSFLICTYRPQWNKLQLTLRSCLLQQDCNYKLVITDDGSEDNFFPRIEEYLQANDFSNYELVPGECNQGIVKNVMKGLQVCDGEYVKPISPGDFMHGNHVLRNWIDFMNEHDDCAMSFGDAIYYHFEDNMIVPTKEYAHPQCANVCTRRAALRNYLMYNDICLGASTLQRRHVWLKYLKLLVDKVIYAEDNTYRFMMYAGEKFIHFPHSVMLYELGSGISTNGSDMWAERLRQDWLATDRLMLSTNACREAQKLHMPEFLRVAKKTGWLGRCQRLRYCPSRVLFRLRCRLFPRHTPVVVDGDFVEQLLNG